MLCCRRAEEAEAELSQLCSRLLNAPDIVSYLCEGLSAQETIKGEPMISKSCSSITPTALKLVCISTRSCKGSAIYDGASAWKFRSAETDKDACRSSKGEQTSAAGHGSRRKGGYFCCFCCWASEQTYTL